MEDLKEKADQYKDQLMSKAASVNQDSVFFTFSKPYSDSIDNGSLFTRTTGLFYQLIGALFLFWPFYVLYIDIDNGIFDSSFKYVMQWLFYFIAFTISCWISFQIFFSRKDKFKHLDRSKGYVATTIASNFIATLGESASVFIAIIGTTVSVIGIFTDNSFGILEYFGLSGTGTAIADLVVFPIIAFCFLLLTRWISEAIMSRADIARNTKK